MRVLCISNMYPPHFLGGYELACRDVMDRFKELGHEVTVLTTTMRLADVAEPGDERAQGVRRELNFYWEDHRLLSPPPLKRLAMERSNQRALAAALDDVNPDVVSVWNMGAMSLALLTTIERRGIPIVANVHDEWLVYGPTLDAWTRLFARRRWIGSLVQAATGVPTQLPTFRETVICFTSEFLKQKSARWPASAETAVVSPGIDERDFPVKEQPPHPWQWRMLVSGRLDERKGIHVAVRALALLPREATLDVIGTGDDGYKAKLEELARELGVSDRVRFGSSPRADLAERYAAADVVLFPVLWEEPFGLVPIEAMASGTPVIATGTGGSGEFLSHEGNCLLVPPKDEVALAAAIRRFATEPTLRRHVVASGYETARVLTIARFAEVLERWHVAAAERFAHGRPEERPPAIAARGEKSSGT